MQFGREDTLEERYAIKFCFKLGKNATETYGLLLDYLASIEHQFFNWHERFKEGMECVRDDERSGKSKEIRTPELIDQIKNFIDKDRRVYVETISAQFDVSVGTVYTIIREELKKRKICAKFVPRVLILVTDYLTKMGIKTVPHPPYSPDLAPCDFWLFPNLKEKLRGCCYETIEEMKEAATKVIDTLTQEDFHGAV